MVNKYQKGKRCEKAAKDLLEEDGYLVEKKNASRWCSDDLWKTFDLIALKRDGSEIRLIQVKSNITHFYKARKEVAQWAIDESVSGISMEVWLKENRKPWVQWKL